MDKGKKHWELDRTINISHILLTLSFIVGIFLWGIEKEKQIHSNKQMLDHAVSMQVRNREESRENDAFFRESVRQVLHKIDDIYKALYKLQEVKRE